MIKILASIFLFFSSHLYAYDEEEIICIATYELAKNFFLDMKDKKTSQEMEMRQQELFNKYDEGHFLRMTLILWSLRFIMPGQIILIFFLPY